MTIEEQNITFGAPKANAINFGHGRPPAIMLHGWGQSLDSLKPLGELLACFGEVHLLDLPGFGLTQKPSTDWDTKQYAQFVLKYLDDNCLDTVDLLGHSFGGRIAIRLASRWPERVRSLILINSHGLRQKRSLPAHFKAKMLKFLGTALKYWDQACGTNIYESWFVQHFGSRDYKNAGPMRNILVKAVREDVSKDAEKIAAPALLLWGEKDIETPVEFGRRFNRLILNSKLIVLPGKDHFPFLGVSAHVCAHYILEFFNALKEQKQYK